MKKGFTLLEILLVVAIIAALASIMIISLNPSKRLTDSNNVKILANSKELEKALSLYVLENNGQFPTEIQTLINQGKTKIPICKPSQSCGGVDLTSTLVNGGYLSFIPVNPNYETTVNTGIEIHYSAQNNSLQVVSGIGTICASVNEGGTINISAPGGSVFKKVRFASYGTPNGTCGNFSLSSCHATASSTIVGNYLVGNNSGSVSATNPIFGDPCGGTYKRLYVEMEY